MVSRSNITANLAMNAPIRIEHSSVLVNYEFAVDRMNSEAEFISQGKRTELIWYLEHPEIYTAGTSAKPTDLVTPNRFPTYKTGRGGQYTYHGPGQRIVYVLLNLLSRGNDVRAFVAALENWIIATLDELGIKAERRDDRVGVWVKTGAAEAKIAAIGIRVKKGITLHGISLNVDPNLSHYDGIIPCGVSELGVTSIRALGCGATLAEVDFLLERNFKRIFKSIGPS